MEENLFLEAKRGLGIRGIFNKAKEKTSGLIIFVHGLGDNQSNHLFFNAAHFFAGHNFSSFRFNLYGEDKKTRKFATTTIYDSAMDLKSVIEYFSKDYSPISVIGHSLGAIVVLLSKAMNEPKKLVFWEPSLHPKDIFATAKFEPTIGRYILDMDYKVLIDKEVIDINRTIPAIPDLLKDVHIPIKIISAGKAGFKVGKDIYFKYANPPKSFEFIPKANHNFDSQKTEQQLFQKTLSWLK